MVIFTTITLLFNRLNKNKFQLVELNELKSFRKLKFSDAKENISLSIIDTGFS